jgi:hypothetical protein
MDKKGKEVSIPCVCINDKGRPNIIPTSKWITKDRQYTIKEFVVHNIQGRIIGVKLWEIDLEGCYPYTTFSITRFGMVIPEAGLEAKKAIEELLEETLKLQEVSA